MVSDKNYLVKLRWVIGNLKSIGNMNYVWIFLIDRGYYYIFYSIYIGNKIINNIDLCFKLNIVYYGIGWCILFENDYILLFWCIDKVLINGGMWFMNKSIGVFLLVFGGIGWGGSSLIGDFISDGGIGG